MRLCGTSGRVRSIFTGNVWLVAIPEIVVYEVRRAILLIDNATSVAEFEDTVKIFGMVPLCTAALELDAEI